MTRRRPNFDGFEVERRPEHDEPEKGLHAVRIFDKNRAVYADAKFTDTEMAPPVWPEIARSTLERDFNWIEL
jgi:hypothetical protein